jgi:hypothetical protein
MNIRRVWELEMRGLSAKRTDPEKVRSGLESSRNELDNSLSGDTSSSAMTQKFVESVIRERRRIREEEVNGRFSLPMFDSAIVI